MEKDIITRLDVYNIILRKFPDIEVVRGLPLSKRFLDFYSVCFVFRFPNHMYIAILRQEGEVKFQVLLYEHGKRITEERLICNLREIIEIMKEMENLK